MRRQQCKSTQDEAILAGAPIRCAFCGALLATAGPEGLRIHRGQLEVIIGGAEHATFVCYRPECRRLNRFTRAALSSSFEPGLSHSADAGRVQKA